MPTRVYLIRHAETARPGVFHAYESDVDLGARGYRQAAALAPVVAGLRPDVLISSNMLRARRPAEALTRATALPIRIEPRQAAPDPPAPTPPATEPARATHRAFPARPPRSSDEAAPPAPPIPTPGRALTPGLPRPGDDPMPGPEMLAGPLDETEALR